MKPRKVKIILRQKDIQHKTGKLYKGGMVHALFIASGQRYRIRYRCDHEPTREEVMVQIVKWTDIKYSHESLAGVKAKKKGKKLGSARKKKNLSRRVEIERKKKAERKRIREEKNGK